MQLPDHPIIDLCLTPRFGADGPHTLDVRLRVQEPGTAASQPLFRYDTFLDNVPTHPYQESDIHATDDLGPLPLAFVTLPGPGPNTQQHWCPARDTHGDVVLGFAAAARHVDRHTPLGARIDLRRDQGGLQGVGRWFLPCVVVVSGRRGKTTMHTNIVRWWLLPDEAPADTRCVWSFGEGGAPVVRVGPASTTCESVYMVGPVRSYPDVVPVGGGAAACY
jgi:hypothetical protein